MGRKSMFGDIAVVSVDIYKNQMNRITIWMANLIVILVLKLSPSSQERQNFWKGNHPNLTHARNRSGIYPVVSDYREGTVIEMVIWEKDDRPEYLKDINHTFWSRGNDLGIIEVRAGPYHLDEIYIKSSESNPCSAEKRDLSCSL